MVDFITNSLYVATIGLRTVAYVEVLHHVIKRGDQLKISNLKVAREQRLEVNTGSLPR